MKLSFNQMRREIYLNLIQDRHLNKLPKDEQLRGRDYETALQSQN